MGGCIGALQAYRDKKDGQDPKGAGTDKPGPGGAKDYSLDTSTWSLDDLVTTGIQEAQWAQSAKNPRKREMHILRARELLTAALERGDPHLQVHLNAVLQKIGGPLHTPNNTNKNASNTVVGGGPGNANLNDLRGGGNPGGGGEQNQNLQQQPNASVLSELGPGAAGLQGTLGDDSGFGGGGMKVSGSPDDDDSSSEESKENVPPSKNSAKQGDLSKPSSKQHISTTAQVQNEASATMGPAAGTSGAAHGGIGGSTKQHDNQLPQKRPSIISRGNIAGTTGENANASGILRDNINATNTIPSSGVTNPSGSNAPNSGIAGQPRSEVVTEDAEEDVEYSSDEPNSDEDGSVADPQTNPSTIQYEELREKSQYLLSGPSQDSIDGITAVNLEKRSGNRSKRSNRPKPNAGDADNNNEDTENVDGHSQNSSSYARNSKSDLDKIQINVVNEAGENAGNVDPKKSGEGVEGQAGADVAAPPTDKKPAGTPILNAALKGLKKGVTAVTATVFPSKSKKKPDDPATDTKEKVPPTVEQQLQQLAKTGIGSGTGQNTADENADDPNQDHSGNTKNVIGRRSSAAGSKTRVLTAHPSHATSGAPSGGSPATGGGGTTITHLTPRAHLENVDIPTLVAPGGESRVRQKGKKKLTADHGSKDQMTPAGVAAVPTSNISLQQQQSTSTGTGKTPLGSGGNNTPRQTPPQPTLQNATPVVMQGGAQPSETLGAKMNEKRKKRDTEKTKRESGQANAGVAAGEQGPKVSGDINPEEHMPILASKKSKNRGSETESKRRSEGGNAFPQIAQDGTAFAGPGIFNTNIPEYSTSLGQQQQQSNSMGMAAAQNPQNNPLVDELRRLQMALEQEKRAKDEAEMEAERLRDEATRAKQVTVQLHEKFRKIASGNPQQVRKTGSGRSTTSVSGRNTPRQGGLQPGQQTSTSEGGTTIVTGMGTSTNDGSQMNPQQIGMTQLTASTGLQNMNMQQQMQMNNNYPQNLNSRYTHSRTNTNYSQQSGPGAPGTLHSPHAETQSSDHSSQNQVMNPMQLMHMQQMGQMPVQQQAPQQFNTLQEKEAAKEQRRLEHMQRREMRKQQAAAGMAGAQPGQGGDESMVPRQPSMQQQQQQQQQFNQGGGPNFGAPGNNEFFSNPFGDTAPFGSGAQFSHNPFEAAGQNRQNPQQAVPNPNENMMQQPVSPSMAHLGNPGGANMAGPFSPDHNAAAAAAAAAAGQANMYNQQMAQQQGAPQGFNDGTQGFGDQQGFNDPSLNYSNTGPRNVATVTLQGVTPQQIQQMQQQGMTPQQIQIQIQQQQLLEQQMQQQVQQQQQQEAAQQQQGQPPGVPPGTENNYGQMQNQQQQQHLQNQHNQQNQNNIHHNPWRHLQQLQLQEQHLMELQLQQQQMLEQKARDEKFVHRRMNMNMTAMNNVDVMNDYEMAAWQQQQGGGPWGPGGTSGGMATGDPLSASQSGLRKVRSFSSLPSQYELPSAPGSPAPSHLSGRSTTRRSQTQGQGARDKRNTRVDADDVHYDDSASVTRTQSQMIVGGVPTVPMTPKLAAAMSAATVNTGARENMVTVRILNGVNGEEHARFQAPCNSSMTPSYFSQTLDQLSQHHSGFAISQLHWLRMLDQSKGGQSERKNCDHRMMSEIIKDVQISQILLCTIPIPPPSSLPIVDGLKLKTLEPSTINVPMNLLSAKELQKSNLKDIFKVRLDTSLLDPAASYSIAFTDQWTNQSYTAEVITKKKKSVNFTVPRQMLALLRQEGNVLFDVHLLVNDSGDGQGKKRSENRRALTLIANSDKDDDQVTSSSNMSQASFDAVNF